MNGKKTLSLVRVEKELQQSITVSSNKVDAVERDIFVARGEVSGVEINQNTLCSNCKHVVQEPEDASKAFKCMYCNMWQKTSSLIKDMYLTLSVTSKGDGSSKSYKCSENVANAFTQANISTMSEEQIVTHFLFQGELKMDVNQQNQSIQKIVEIENIK